jgi:uncharacterized protein YndB with AHSA1/START domain
VPRFAATRTLGAPPDDVWAVLADPAAFPDWWPGIEHVEAGRQGLAPAARWQLTGPDRPSLLRRPQTTGTLLVLAVAPPTRLAFQLTGDRVEAELELRSLDDGRTEASLVVEAPSLSGIRRRFPAQVLARLDALVARKGE